MEYVLGALLWLGLWLASEVVGEVIGAAVERTVTPVWRRFVGLLNGRVILALWGAASAAMAMAWNLAGTESTATTLGGIFLFIAPPTFVLLATLAWRSRGWPRRPLGRSGY